ncbi:MAG: hypothetical protein ABGZ35_13180 [Planctomycetaceae bacterium]
MFKSQRASSSRILVGQLRIPTDEQSFEPTLDVALDKNKLAATYITGDKP